MTMCNSEGCSERAQVLADETDQARRPHDGVPHRGSCGERGALLTVANDAEGRSGSGAARVVPVGRLEELAERWELEEAYACVNAGKCSRCLAYQVAVMQLRRTIADHATTVDPETTRPGFTDRDESDREASEAPESTPDGSTGAESVSAVERAARVIYESDAWENTWWDAESDSFRAEYLGNAQALADHGLLRRPTWTQVFDEAQLARAEGERDRARGTAVALEQENARLTEEREAWRNGCESAREDAAQQWLRAENAEAAVERLHSWVGLMELLDEHWPERIFPTLPDDEDRDTGPRLVSALRRADRAEARVTDLEAEGERLRDERAELVEEVKAAEARARRAEDALQRVRHLCDNPSIRRWIDDSTLVDVADLRRALATGQGSETTDTEEEQA